MTEKEKMLNGELYLASDPELVEERQKAKEVIFDALKVIDDFERTEIYKKLVNVKGRASFGMGLKFDYGSNIFVGDNFYCNFDCTMLDVCRITFGDNCMLGPNVQIYTATHPLNAIIRNEGAEYGKEVTIGDNVWIGGSAVIFPGVTLGNNVVVSAGSVVTKSFEDNVLIGGNPAKVLKNIEE